MGYNFTLQENQAKYPFKNWHHSISMHFLRNKPNIVVKDLIEYFQQQLAELNLTFNGCDLGIPEIQRPKEA